MYALRELILWTVSGFSRSLHRPVDPLRHYYVQSQNKGELSQVNQCTSFQTKLSIKPLQLTKNKGQGKKKNCKTWKKKQQQQQQPNKQEANRKKIDKYQKCVFRERETIEAL